MEKCRSEVLKHQILVLEDYHKIIVASALPDNNKIRRHCEYFGDMIIKPE
jgi:hypothetical protein